MGSLLQCGVPVQHWITEPGSGATLDPSAILDPSTGSQCTTGSRCEAGSQPGAWRTGPKLPWPHWGDLGPSPPGQAGGSPDPVPSVPQRAGGSACSRARVSTPDRPRAGVRLYRPGCLSFPFSPHSAPQVRGEVSVLPMALRRDIPCHHPRWGSQAVTPSHHPGEEGGGQVVVNAWPGHPHCPPPTLLAAGTDPASGCGGDPAVVADPWGAPSPSGSPLGVTAPKPLSYCGDHPPSPPPRARHFDH